MINKDLIKMLFIKFDRKANDKKTSKQDRKTYIEINKKLLELLEK